jgi:hypothetical protein
MTMLLVLNMPHPVKASTCTSSAMAGGVKRASSLVARNSLVQAQRLPPQPLADHGCSSASVANGGQGASCGAANNGQGGVLRGSGSSCFASNQNVLAQPPQAQPPQAQPPTAFAPNTR